MVTVTKDRNYMLQKEHKEGTNHLGKGLPKDSEEIPICPGP